jgi:CRP-like cAMP-binding protein
LLNYLPTCLLKLTGDLELHFCHVDDMAAANTIQRLAMLDQTDIYRPLPSGLMLNWPVNSMLPDSRPGEPVIWEGEYHDDVYFLLDGRLEVVVTVLATQPRLLIL